MEKATDGRKTGKEEQTLGESRRRKGITDSRKEKGSDE